MADATRAEIAQAEMFPRFRRVLSEQDYATAGGKADEITARLRATADYPFSDRYYARYRRDIYRAIIKGMREPRSNP